MITYPIIRMNIGGAAEEFSRTDIISASLVQQVNPISAELTASEVEFTIYTADDKYSIFSDGTYYSSLSKKQLMEVSEMVNGVEVFIGKFYLDDWKYISETQFWFKGMDIIGMMDYVTFDGRFYEEDTPLSTIVDDILENHNINHVVLNPAATVALRGWIPPGTVRESLQLACFSAGAMVLSTRDQVVIGESRLVVDSPTETVVIGDADKKVAAEEVDLLPMVTKISLVSHAYSKGVDLVTIYEQDLAPGSYKVVFQEPYYDVIATGVGGSTESLTTEGAETLTTEDGEELVISGEFVYGPNFIYLTVDIPGGHVKIEGYPWVDSQQVHIHEEVLDESTKENQLEIKEATLVSPTIGAAILARLVDYYSQRYKQRITLLNYQTATRYYGDAPEFGSGLYETDPAARVGEIVLATTYKTKQLLGVIEKVETDLTGGFIVDMENIGVEA